MRGVRGPRPHCSRAHPAGGGSARGTGPRGYGTRGNRTRGGAARGSATRGCTTTRTNSHRTGRPVASAGDQDTGTGPGTAEPSVACTGRSSLTCTGSQCRRGPSGVSGLPGGWRTSRAAPACGAAPGHLRRPGSSQNLLGGHPSAQAAPRTGCPARARLTGSPRVRAQRRLKPCPAPTGHRVRGAVATAWPARSRARLAGQHLDETGRGPDSCPYRQPGAPSCRASRMFLITCYGLTPRCR